MRQDGAIKSRNTSLDLLRTISMLMIVVLHVNSHGGVLNNISNVNTTTARLFEYFCV
jgi:surface polysaccharide O-acyltransferase-like enzyme